MCKPSSFLKLRNKFYTFLNLRMFNIEVIRSSITPLPIQEFYDDLNARNKAAAEAARAEYEKEEQARLDAASMDQLIAVEDLAIEDGTTPVAIEDGTTVTPVAASLPSEEQTPVAKVVSLPSEPYQSERLEMVGNSSALVAAASEEEDEEKVAESEG
eukprot:sb/3473120/